MPNRKLHEKCFVPSPTPHLSRFEMSGWSPTETQEGRKALPMLSLWMWLLCLWPSACQDKGYLGCPLLCKHHRYPIHQRDHNSLLKAVLALRFLKLLWLSFFFVVVVGHVSLSSLHFPYVQAEKNRAAAMANNLQKGTAGPMRLYVGSLHFNITEDMLRGIFEPFGRVKDTSVMLTCAASLTCNLVNLEMSWVVGMTCIVVFVCSRLRAFSSWWTVRRVDPKDMALSRWVAVMWLNYGSFLSLRCVSQSP